MKTRDDVLLTSGQVILIFVCAAILYFGLGAFDFPITEAFRD